MLRLNDKPALEVEDCNSDTANCRSDQDWGKVAKKEPGFDGHQGTVYLRRLQAELEPSTRAKPGFAENSSSKSPWGRMCLQITLGALLNNTFVLTALLTVICAAFLAFLSSLPFNMSCCFMFFPILCFVAVSRFVDSVIQKAARASSAADESRSLWHGLSGSTVMLLAVLCPFATASYFNLYFPQEASALLTLSWISPVANLLAWQSLRKEEYAFFQLKKYLLVLSIFYQALILTFTLFSGSEFHLDKLLLQFSAAASLVISICILLRLNKRATKSGFAKSEKLALLVTAGVCLLPQADSIAKSVAIAALDSKQESLSQIAFDFLRGTEYEQEIILKNSIETPGREFLQPIHTAERDSEVYYKLTGNPLWSKLEAKDPMGSDDIFYASPATGKALNSLSISKSQINANLNAEALAASFSWDLKLDNISNGPGREARLIINLPAASRLQSVSILGKNQDARLPKNQTSANIALLSKEGYKLYSREAVRLRDPVFLTALSDRKVMLHAAPLLPNSHMKLRLQISSPFLVSDKDKMASLKLPFICASNMGRSAVTQVRVKSHGVILDEKGRNIDNKRVLSLGQKSHEIKFQVPLAKLSQENVLRLSASGASRKEILEGRLANAKNTSSVVLAIDASSASAKHKEQIKEFLGKQHAIVAATLIADPRKGLKKFAGQAAEIDIVQASFSGGDTNWDLLAASIEEAKLKGADSVLWIHGPKEWTGCSNRKKWEDSYDEMKAPFDLAKLCGPAIAIYDFELDNGANAVLEMSHAAACDPSCFKTLERNDKPALDLDRICRDWQDNAGKRELQFAKATCERSGMNSKKTPALCLNEDLSQSVLALARSSEIKVLQSSGRLPVENYCLQHALLGPYTSLYADKEQDLPLDTFSSHDSGKTQVDARADAQVIEGISAAGIVRVNGLANLEALLNILANGAEIGGIFIGLPMFLRGLVALSTKAGRLRLLFGLGFITIGLAVPGIINWLVASSRDSGGFS